ncbi:hypothetical protein KFE96_08110 [Kordiimonas sp. SCSIO 12603]|uniref:hypothetical protein n=1 Tax=Kordiimonas sp. SCSIO 12603 TaxID=2829596 RepID=UPI0021059AB8|nr:hypothetical protein [Kordiimonas sp. SCSIO 12603]UTW60266.1 hypothetical protein KFE96_08110 [Kordiimonas sp. SCSIO 12603]
MISLDANGKNLLKYLVQKLPQIQVHRPDLFPQYKQTHDELGLRQLGKTWGESLQPQGLDNLGEWTKLHNLPAITGLIVSEGTLLPGGGFYKLYGINPKEDNWVEWWQEQLSKCKEYNWLQHL